MGWCSVNKVCLHSVGFIGIVAYYYSLQAVLLPLGTKTTTRGFDERDAVQGWADCSRNLRLNFLQF